MIPLQKSDIEAIKNMTIERLAQNKDTIYETEKFSLGFREQTHDRTFYFDICYKTRTKDSFYGIGGGYVFDTEKLQGFQKLLKNTIND